DTEGEPLSRTLDYAALGARAAPEDEVVLCLGYVPTHLEELTRARELVRAYVKAVAGALGA
ncbi:MAG TPA: hypothetical protein VEZ71_26365, partial [Archangium sp.]|nr:hypothetical protein [Archangium sp.]